MNTNEKKGNVVTLLLKHLGRKQVTDFLYYTSQISKVLENKERRRKKKRAYCKTKALECTQQWLQQQ